MHLYYIQEPEQNTDFKLFRTGPFETAVKNSEIDEYFTRKKKIYLYEEIAGVYLYGLCVNTIGFDFKKKKQKKGHHRGIKRRRRKT